MSMNAMPVSGGNADSSSLAASRPPADAPIPTTQKGSAERDSSSVGAAGAGTGGASGSISGAMRKWGRRYQLAPIQFIFQAAAIHPLFGCFDEQVPQHVRVLSRFFGEALVVLDHANPVGGPVLDGHSVQHVCALLEETHGGPQRGLDRFIFGGEQRLRAIRVADATAIACHVGRFLLPQGSAAFRTAEDGK